MTDKEILVNASDLQRYVVKDAKPTGVVLGTGSYGSVLEFKLSRASCAGKKLHDVLLKEAKGEGLKYVVDRFKRECHLLASLRHPNVVQFLGLAFVPDSFLPCLLMERLDCSLDDFLENHRDIPLSTKRSILLDVSSGLVYLHGHDPPVIHRDLTSKNVLLTPALTAKLADLGNSRFIDTSQLSSTMTTAPGTSVYMPPEAVQQKSHYGSDLDIFSFGHLTLYVLTETFPCDLLPSVEPDPKNQDKLIPRTEVQRRAKYFTILRSKLSRRRHQSLVNLVERCLHNAPNKRPTALELHTTLDALQVDHEDDPTAIQMELRRLNSPPPDRFALSLQTEEEKAQEKIGMLKRFKSLRAISKRWNTVVLKMSMGKHIQILRRNDQKTLEQVDISDIDEVESIPGDDFQFAVHFKDNRKPWKFSALSEEERSDWIKAITCALLRIPLQSKENEREKTYGYEQETHPGQDSSPVKSVYDIKPDLSPNRARTKAFSFSPEVKRPEWTYGSTLSPDMERRSGASYEPQREKSYSLPGMSSREDAYPPLTEDIPSPQPVPKQNRKHKLSVSAIMAALATKASDYFDPQQVVLLMEMFEQMKKYLEPEHEEVSSQPSGVDPAGATMKSTMFSPEEMLTTSTEEETGFEWPQWAKASVTVTSDTSPCDVEDDALNILPSTLTEIEEIQDGRFGKVYKAILDNSEGGNIQVVMKATKVYSEGEMKNFKTEMAILSKMMHPNIVRLYGLVQEGEYAPSIVLDFLPQGDLKKFLMEKERSPRKLMKYMVDIAMGMHYISEKGLIHRDLAAHNILVGVNETCKISDFGLVRELPRDDSIYASQSDLPGPIRWMAPETIKTREFFPASDVWSFGVLMWEMFNPSKIPYSNMSNEECAHSVSQGCTLPIPRGCPSIVTRVMRFCWTQNPARRPSFFLIATTLSKATL